jgi:plastocyanin
MLTRSPSSHRTPARLLAALALGSLIAAGCVGELPSSIGDGAGGSSAQTGNGAGGPGPGSGPGSGTGGSGGAPIQEATFQLSVDNAAPSMELRAEAGVTIRVDPNGYVGPVALSLEGVPADVTAELAPASVDLDGATEAMANVSFTTLSSTQSGQFQITAAGTVASGEKSTTLTLTVEPAITITIPAGINNMQGTGVFGDYPTVIKAVPGMSAQSPIRVRFFNADNLVHSIHADNDGQGFPHGDDIIPGMYEVPERLVNSPGTYNYYPHDIGQSILGQIVIE